MQATQQQYLKLTKNEQLPLPANAMSLVVTELTIIAATIWPDPKTKLVEPPRSSIPCRWNSKEILELLPQGVRIPTLVGLYGFIALTGVDTLLSKFQVSPQTWL